MTNENEKATAFLNAINDDAQKRCDQMKSEINKYISIELQKARETAKEEVKSIKKNELDRLIEENNSTFSALEAEETKKLIDRRTQIKDEVFANAEQKIKEFAASEAYIDFLIESVKNINETIGADTVIILKPSDKKYESKLKHLCSSIKYDNSITIGGCKAENLKANLTADDTLESRLEAAKQSFYKNSGLSITL